MPNQSALGYNKGITSGLIFKTRVNNKGVATQDTGSLFQHQDFSSIHNFVDDRVKITPNANPVVKLGDEISFDLIPDADGLAEVDFRCTLPALCSEPSVYFDEDNTNAVSRPPAGATSFTTQNKHNVWAGYFDNVSFKSAAGASANDFMRYRIPNNPGAPFLKDNTDYAVCAGGPCGIEFAGPVSDALNGHIVNACRPPSFNGTLNPAGTHFTGGSTILWPELVSPPAGFTASSVRLDELMTKSYDIPCPIYCDYVGYWMLERIEVKQTTNPIQQFSGTDMFLFDQIFHNNETSDHYAEMTGAWHPDGLGGKWSALDVSLCRQQRDIIVPLDFLFWVGKISQFLPIIALHVPINLKIKLREQSSCILFERLQYSSTIPRPANDVPTVLPVNHSKPVILTEVKLELHKFHYDDVYRTENLAMIDSPMGEKWKCLDVEILPSYPVYTSTKGGNGTDIPLQGLRLAVTSFIFTKLHAADKGAANANYWTNFLRVNNFAVKAGRDEIIPETDHNYAKLRMPNLYNNSRLARYEIYAHHFSKHPSDKFNAWGHMEFLSLHSALLTLNYARDYVDPTSFYVPGIKGYGIRKHHKSTGSPVSNAAVETGTSITFPATSDSVGHLVDIVCRSHQQIQIKSGNVQKHFH